MRGSLLRGGIDVGNARDDEMISSVPFSDSSRRTDGFLRGGENGFTGLWMDGLGLIDGRDCLLGPAFYDV